MDRALTRPKHQNLMRLRSDLTSIRPVRLMIVMVVGHFLKKTRQIIFDFWIGLYKFFKKSSPLAI